MGEIVLDEESIGFGIQKCPFCGSKALPVQSDSGNYRIYCVKNYCQATTAWWSNLSSVIKAWNNRV